MAADLWFRLPYHRLDRRAEADIRRALDQARAKGREDERERWIGICDGLSDWTDWEGILPGAPTEAAFAATHIAAAAIRGPAETDSG